MKLMNGNVFIDSNVLVYCYSKTEREKQQKAFYIIDSNPFLFISSQVIQEFCNIAHKKLFLQEGDLHNAILEIESVFSIYNNTVDTVKRANSIKYKYNYSFYDSLILAAALECNCHILFSEDMQEGQVIENKLRIINPFN
jgi:predicted nucleic acid-binding protein